MGDEEQLHLGPGWENTGLFSRNFLESHISDEPYWGCDDHAGRVLAEITSLYRDEYKPARQEHNEEDTRNAWLDPVLKALGWEYHRERRIQRGRPDYMLYDSRAHKQHAAKGTGDRFSHAATVLEAKYWDRPLNNWVPQDTLDSSDATGQLLSYLTQLDVRTDGRCQWAMLTNGRVWRLFHSRAKGRATSFYEVDLLELMNRRDPEQFKYFLCFFEPRAFSRDPQIGKTRLDLILTESRRYAERVSESLKEAIFDAHHGVFIELARGFIEHRTQRDPDAAISQPDLDEIHDATLTLLYRLLFLLYAESRELLPVRDETGYGHQSLAHQARRCADLTDGRYVPPTRSTDIWSDLLTLFDVVCYGDPNLDVPVYNGGLFEPKMTARGEDFFATSAVTDGPLAAAIDSLTRTTDEFGQRAWIDYSSLDVQQLGSIYEGLLEFRLRFAPERLVAVKEKGVEKWKPQRALGKEDAKRSEDDTCSVVDAGGLYLTNDRGERKATGSYYTPDDLVKYIVRHTVGPILHERQAEAKRLLAQLARKHKAHRRLSSTEGIRASDKQIRQLSDRIFDTLFDIRVLDPAMGSGHFLVETVDVLSDGIIEFLSSEEVRQLLGSGRKGRGGNRAAHPNPVLVKIEQQRRHIMQGLADQGIALTAEKQTALQDKLSDNNLIRRMVLKRCIYGVDLNPAAVELAKVSLWLHCFTLGAPLSFLDHHLRCGNSLVGMTVHEVEQDLKTDLFGSRFAGLLRATEFMCKVGQLTDSTFAEVKQSVHAYRSATEEITPFKAMLDMWTAELFDVGPARDLLRRGITYLQLHDSTARADHEELDAGATEILLRAEQTAADKRFFHWELEFPEVWYGAGTRRDRPGFDAVVGNPPWERIKLQEREFFRDRAPEIGSAVSAATRRKLIDGLRDKAPDLHAEYVARQSDAEALSKFLRACGQYPFTARGDMNTYLLFTERAYGKVRATGRVGLLVPSGISSDKTTAPFFRELMDTGRLLGLYDFENRRGIFPEVHRSFKFSVAFLGGAEVRTRAADFAFFAHDVSDLADRDRHIPLSAGDMALVNPNTKTCPIFRSRRDAELTKAIYGRVPVLVDESRGDAGNPWGIRFFRMFDQTNDADLFHTAEQMQKMGLVLKGNRWTDTRGRTFLPLYEAKMVQAFDHRAASVIVADENWVRQGQTAPTTPEQHRDPCFQVLPRWWVDQSEVQRALHTQQQAAYVCFKDITSPTNERTMIAGAVPLAGATNKLILVLCDREMREQLCLLGNLNSFVLDYACRQKIGGISLNFFIVNQLPVLPPQRYDETCPWDPQTALRDWIADRVLELTYTAADMRPLAEACGFTGDPYVWDEDRRAILRAELDAAYFVLYGLSRDQVEYVFTTFPGTRRKDEREHGYFRSASLTLANYERLANAT